MASLVEGRTFYFPSFYDSPISGNFTEDDSVLHNYAARLSVGRSRNPLSVDDVPVVDAMLGNGRNNSSTSSVFLENDVSISPPTCNLPCMPGLTPQIVTPTAKLETNLEDIFLAILEELGPSWKDVGRSLLKREYLLQSIDQDYTGVKEKAYQMLLMWYRQKGSQANVEELCRTLIQMNCFDATEKLAELEPSLSSLLHFVCPALRKESILYNTTQTYRDFRCEKCITCGNMEMIHLWQCKSTEKKYIVKTVEDSRHAYALRKVINAKAFQQRKKNLRKTEQFLRDLEEKQKMVKHLLGVVEHLQAHIINHWKSCQQELSCGECDKSKLQQHLIQSELTLLHHELKRMIYCSHRRISFSGIPSERIYHLAGRAYTVCEEHVKMHQQVRRRKSCVSLNDQDTASEDSSDDDLVGPLQCTLMILLKVGRRRAVTQSYRRSKKTVKHDKLKKTKSSESTSTFYLPSPVRSNYHFARGDKSPISFQMASDILRPSKVTANGSSTSRVDQVTTQVNNHNSVIPRMDGKVTPKSREQNPKSISTCEDSLVLQSAESHAVSSRRGTQAATMPRSTNACHETFFRRLSQHNLQWSNDLEGSVQV